VNKRSITTLLPPWKGWSLDSDPRNWLGKSDVEFAVRNTRSVLTSDSFRPMIYDPHVSCCCL